MPPVSIQSILLAHTMNSTNDNSPPGHCECDFSRIAEWPVRFNIPALTKRLASMAVPVAVSSGKEPP
jgi:hypothetical protein